MENRISNITQELLNSYQQVGGINNIDGLNLPSKHAVGTICEDLLQILFPGFHDRDPVYSSDIERVTSFRLANIANNLRTEICKSLRIKNSDCPDEKAEEMLCAFLSRIPSVRELLATDVEAAYEGDPAGTSYEEIILAYPFLETISIQRLAHTLYKLKLPILPRIMTEWAHSRTGIDIHPGATIGSHFFIDHGTGVVIGETCIIGTHVKLYHSVTLGARSFKKDPDGKIIKGGQRHPQVEDHVTIYPGSTILGGETVIGTRSTIGGNVFLTHSVPPDTLVYYEERQLKIVSKRNRPASSPTSQASHASQ